MCVKRFFGLFFEIFTHTLFFHAHFNLHLIIRFYDFFGQNFAFFEIFTHTMKFSRKENQFFSRKGVVFSRRKKKHCALRPAGFPHRRSITESQRGSYPHGLVQCFFFYVKKRHPSVKIFCFPCVKTSLCAWKFRKKLNFVQKNGKIGL